MGCGQKAAAEDMRDWSNWRKNLSETDNKVIEVMKQIKELETNCAFTKVQFDKLEFVQKTLIEILPKSDWNIKSCLNDQLKSAVK